MQFERLVIAEKPELAKAIVEGLGGGSRKDGYYECGSDRVTWCYGHMLALLAWIFHPIRFETRKPLLSRGFRHFWDPELIL